jgi:predicted tellurium resistance membrane protein TerC
MPSPRRVVAVFAGLVLAGVGFNAAAQPPGDNAAAPATAAVPVEIERADGTKLTGSYAGGPIKLRTDFGTADLAVTSVKTVDVTSGGNQPTASLTLTDKSHMSGPLLTATLDVVVDGKPRAIPVNELTRVSFKHPKDTSVAGAIIGLLTLTLMEIVLGVDNIIFLAVVAGRLPVEQQRAARRLGLGAALGTRLLLLLSLTWLLGLTKPVFTLPELPFFQTAEARGVSWRDLILLAGGVFLIGKSTWEMHAKVEGGKHGAEGRPKKPASFGWVIAEIAVIDIIFSLDSVITAVGMVDELWVMVTAVIVAVGIMLVAAEPISRFVDRRPTIKVLALSFLILIGVLLVAEGLGQHLNKGYIYFAMAFAIGVELVNMRLRPGSGEPLQEMPKTA